MSRCITLRWHLCPTLNAALKLIPLSCGGGLISLVGPVPWLHVDQANYAVGHISESSTSLCISLFCFTAVHFISSGGQLELLLGCLVVALSTVCCSESGLLSEMLLIHCRAFASSGHLASVLLLLFSWVAVSIFIPSLQTVFNIAMRMSGLYRGTSTELLSWGN